ncbi:MAG: hypothetical protein ACXWCA_04650 [Kaistella sp.]
MKISNIKGKTFILIIPNDFIIHEIFELNLKKMGFDLLSIVPKDFRYKNYVLRIKNFIHKNIYKNRNYKKKLIRDFRSQDITTKIGDLHEKSIDYILIIRPDILDNETIDHLLKIGKKVVAYQWDGLNRYPEVFDCIPLFEKFLIFDERDFLHYKTEFPNLEICDNFFFDFDDGKENKQNSRKVFYVGSYIEDRTSDLLFTLNELEKYDVEFDVNLKYYRSTKPCENPHIQFFKNNILFRENINRLKEAKIILDFKVKEHNGLSLRFFEALKYEKKIITNNVSVLKYDFYDPQNIFILHHDNINDLGTFVSSDYKKLPVQLVEKYSFSSWLNKYVI